MAPQQSRLIALPRELRDHIYREYIFLGAEDGYIYDFGAGKLRTADHQPIDLSLMYTCRLIAAEMEGLALRLQTITFSTLFSDALCVRANFWETIVQQERCLHDLKRYAPIMTEEMAQEVGRRYGGTHFYAAFCRMRDDDFVDAFGGGDSYERTRKCLGEVPSVFRQMARDVMQLAMTDPAIYEKLAWAGSLVKPPYRKRCDPSVVYRVGEAPWEPWKIPTACELETLAEQVANSESEIFTREYYTSGRQCLQRFRFSAAAAAIHFLNSIPGNRQHVRNIILHEDRSSVALPQCHSRGLIPFCQENPHLRVERRVSLWNNIFLTCHSSWAPNLVDGGLSAAHDAASWDDSVRLEADAITRRVAEYMVEASVPEIPDAITLVLDGDPLPRLTSQIFREVVQRDAAWQTALDRTFTAERGAHPHDIFYKRSMEGFLFVGFPELMHAMARQRAGDGGGGRGRDGGLAGTPESGPPRCLVRCNFDPGEPWDDERIVAEIEEPNSDCPNGLFDWWDAWQREDGYQTEPPLPEYHRLFGEDVYPTPYLDVSPFIALDDD